MISLLHSVTYSRALVKNRWKREDRSAWKRDDVRQDGRGKIVPAGLGRGKLNKFKPH
jgi:hypothetical protein